MKQHQLKIEELTEVEGCSVVAYLSKGHHHISEFAQAVKTDYNPENSMSEIMNRTKHKWAKLVPWCGTNQSCYTYSREQRKGYFPVTVFEV